MHDGHEPSENSVPTGGWRLLGDESAMALRFPANDSSASRVLTVVLARAGPGASVQRLRRLAWAARHAS